MKRIAAALMGALIASPASAQWTRVEQVPDANIYSVFTTGDTIAAASDSTVFVSTDAGATWITSATVAAGATTVEAVRLHKGVLYAGTFGQGVFVSSDLGVNWRSFNEGLVGGFADSQLRIMDLLARGDTLYAATGGAGPWIRNLTTGGWSHYGNVLEPAQASNMEALATSDTRLFACAGGNGDIYYRDPGDADWSYDYLLNGQVAAGLASLAAIWTGGSWLVGTNIGAFHSAAGQSPWTYIDFGLHPTFFTSFALHDGVVFVHFANGAGTGVEYSVDDGTTWQVLDRLPAIFTYEIASLGSMLYAGRVDGLWRRSVANVFVPPAGPAPNVRFALVGPHPIHDQARFRVELPEAGRARIGIFDLAGRRMPGGIDQLLPAGASEMTWDAAGTAPGVYMARLDAGGRTQSLRVVRVR
ncbi:MAG TPA: hypothetical protein VFK69_02780 [Candidatus Eisenbacteria bacterium]|nr:hypothetical protein [Candidatus Eisenbacteria bacterium]